MSFSFRFVLAGWLCGTALGAYGQAARFPSPLRLTVRAEYDRFFGFDPSISLSKSLDSLRELTGYCAFYPNPAFFGFETGVMFGYTSPRKTWTLVPGLGLVSGSVFVEGRPFRVGEGYVGSLAVQYERAKWYAQGYGIYYGALQRRLPDTYDVALYSLQAGRRLGHQTRLGLVGEWLGYVRRSRNDGNADEFAVLRYGLALSQALPAGLRVEAAGGLAHGDPDHRTFFQVGVSHSFVRAR